MMPVPGTICMAAPSVSPARECHDASARHHLYGNGTQAAGRERTRQVGIVPSRPNVDVSARHRRRSGRVGWFDRRSRWNCSPLPRRPRVPRHSACSNAVPQPYGDRHEPPALHPALGLNAQARPPGLGGRTGVPCVRHPLRTAGERRRCARPTAGGAAAWGRDHRRRGGRLPLLVHRRRSRPPRVPRRQASPGRGGSTWSTVTAPSSCAADDLEAALVALGNHLQVAVAELAQGRVFVHAGVVGWQRARPRAPRHHPQRQDLARARALPRRRHLPLGRFRGARRRTAASTRLPAHSACAWQPTCRGVRRPGRSSRSPPPIGPLPVGTILFTHYETGTRLAPEPLTPGTATLRLLEHAVPARRDPERVLGALGGLAERAPAFAAPRGEAAVAAGVVRTLVEAVTEATRTTEGSDGGRGSQPAGPPQAPGSRRLPPMQLPLQHWRLLVHRLPPECTKPPPPAREPAARSPPAPAPPPPSAPSAPAPAAARRSTTPAISCAAARHFWVVSRSRRSASSTPAASHSAGISPSSSPPARAAAASPPPRRPPRRRQRAEAPLERARQLARGPPPSQARQIVAATSLRQCARWLSRS